MFLTQPAIATHSIPKGVRRCGPEFFLHSSGLANSLNGDGTLSRERCGDEEPDTFIYDPRAPVGSLGGRSFCRYWVFPMGPADQRSVEITNAVLV